MIAFLAALAKTDASICLMLALIFFALLARLMVWVQRSQETRWKLAAQVLCLGAISSDAFWLASRCMVANRVPLDSQAELLLSVLLVFGLIALWMERRRNLAGLAFLTQVLLFVFALLALALRDVEAPTPTQVLLGTWHALRLASMVIAHACLGFAACLALETIRLNPKDDECLQIRFWIRGAFVCFLTAMAAGTLLPGAPLLAGLPWSVPNAQLFCGALACAMLLHLQRLRGGSPRALPMAVIFVWIISLAALLA